MKKIILITGASTGIGFASLEKLVADGHKVYGTARKRGDMDRIKKAGAQPLKMEMTDYSSIEKAIAEIIKVDGQIDVLFNNAGYGLYGSVEQVPVDEAKHQFDVNLFGLARVTQLVTPHMRKKQSGTIINTSSMGGRMWTPFGAWYHATKHALEGWSDCLRFELAPFGIKVAILEPGAIHTPWGNTMRDNLMKYSGKGPYGERVEAMANSSDAAYKRGGGSDPSVIANTVSKIVASKRPKARYAAGKYAKLLMFVRKFSSDKVYDKIISRMVR